MIEPEEGMKVFLSQMGGSGNLPTNNGEDPEGPDFRVWVYKDRRVLEAELAGDAIEWMRQVKDMSEHRRDYEDAQGMIESLVIVEGQLTHENGKWMVGLEDGEQFGPIEFGDA